MSQIDPKFRIFTERLIAFETKKNVPSGSKIPVPCLASEKLRPHLAALMGSITTGYGANGLDDSFRGQHLLTKPFGVSELEHMIVRALSEDVGGS